ncbi:MAG: BamA/TamA family outer membrane protein [Phycisphaerae bacterium]|nr:BamA/TamA family outer membrane protein [Saprospiraceae bacterium]
MNRLHKLLLPQPSLKLWLVNLLLLLALSACNVTKHLDAEKGERLLVKNALKIKSEKKLSLSAKSALSNELAPFYRQKPNRRNLGIFYPRLWFYYKYRDRKSDFAKWINKRIAEPPAVYDSILAQRTALNFKNQIRQKGYFRAESSFKTTLIGKYKAKVAYQLILGPRYTVENVQFASRDTQILTILHTTAGESLIKQGTPLDIHIFDAEKLRITSILKNRGYAYFIPQYIEFGGDSTDTKANVTIEVLPYNDSTMHRTYTIGKVDVLSGVVPNFSSVRRDTTIRGVYFAAAEAKLWIRPTLLRKKILLNPDSLFRQSNFDQTLRNLNALGVYRFVSLRPLQDSTESDKINVTVNLSPNKRFSPGGDLDFNYSRNSISNGLLGLSPIFFLQNRNLLSGAENLQSSVSYNIEFDIANPKIVFSQEFKFQNDLLFPRFFDYFGFWRVANKIHVGKKRVFSKGFYQRIRSDGEAKLSLNYNYLHVTDFYSYHLSNVSFGYRVRSHPEHQYYWDHIGFDVLRPRFDSLLVPGEFLQRSFGNQLFTGLVLRNFNYTYANRPNRFGERWNYRFSYELSGLEVLAANSLWPLITGKEEPVWRIGDLDFAKFLRFDQEAVYTRNFTPNLVGAVRIGAGVATPFGDSRAVPFVKQFFVGGPSSLRAWRIRELGPGGYVPRDSLSNEARPLATQPFYQAADFRFEFGGELRFPLFLWLKGAVFIDGGNIWTLRKDPDRLESELRWDSYKNIAIGTGVGLRMDLDYFVLRMDFGVPLRRPYADENGGGYWVRDFFTKMKFNPNLAVGYPF